MFGKARMEMKVALTFACMNLKKLARMKGRNILKETTLRVGRYMYTNNAPKTLKALLA